MKKTIIFMFFITLTLLSTAQINKKNDKVLDVLNKGNSINAKEFNLYNKKIKKKIFVKDSTWGFTTAKYGTSINFDPVLFENLYSYTMYSEGFQYKDPTSLPGGVVNYRRNTQNVEISRDKVFLEKVKNADGYVMIYTYDEEKDQLSYMTAKGSQVVFTTREQKDGSQYWKLYRVK